MLQLSPTSNFLTKFDFFSPPGGALTSVNYAPNLFLSALGVYVRPVYPVGTPICLEYSIRLAACRNLTEHTPIAQYSHG